MTLNFDNLSALQLDAIQEVGNIGVGNAATALSHMVNKKVEITVPYVRIASITEVADYTGGAEAIVVATYVKVLGDVNGYMSLIFDERSTRRLVSLLTYSDHATNLEDEMSQSVVKEIGNILSSNFMIALASMTKLITSPSVPALAVDMAGAIMNSIVADTVVTADYVVIIDTIFSIEGETVTGNFIFIPTPTSLNLILHSLGVGGF